MVRSDVKRMINEVLRYLLQTMRPEEKDQYIYDRLYDEILREWDRDELEKMYKEALFYHEAHSGK